MKRLETVRGFCYLGDMGNASGGREAAVTARTRMGGEVQVMRKVAELKKVLA